MSRANGIPQKARGKLPTRAFLGWIAGHAYQLQPFWYNLLGGNLVGGGIALLSNVLIQESSIDLVALIGASVNVVCAGALMSSVAWRMGLVHKELDVLAAEDTVTREEILEHRAKAIAESAWAISISLIEGAILVFVALGLLLVGSVNR